MKRKVVEKESNKNKTNRRKIALIIGVVAGVLVFVFGSFFIYVKAYENKILPKITIGGVTIGGLESEAARQKIDEVSKSPLEGKVKISIGDKTFEESTESLGLGYDTSATIDRLYEYGHSADWWQNIWPHLRALLGPVHMYPELSDNQKTVDDWINTIALEVDDPMQNANIEVKDGVAYIIESKDGNQINQQEISGRITESFLNFTAPDLIAEKLATYPEISRQDAESLATQAVEATSESLVMIINEEKYTVYPNILGKWIVLEVDDISKTSWWMSVARAQENEISITFDAGEIQTYLDENIAPMVNVEAQDAKFTFSGGGISPLSPSVEGKKLNSEKVAGDIAGLLAESDQREIDVALEIQKARVNEEVIENVAKYGIKELIGTGTTSFAKSPTNRIHNIKTGAQFLNGIVIAPGEEFSTINHLGSIDGSSGYLEELVIKEDRTEPEFGGGLCQVSTTLFRAAMNAGLKITERSNHSYRVSYYEPPVGMDATIYSPKPDLKFVNNTGKYILVQSSISGNKITFNFYGTSDGRRVEISDTETYDETSPGDTIYVEDPTMEPGTEKYLERAHAGIKAVFYYKVYKSDGSLMLDQTFKSAYVPWPARIARGPEKAPEEAGGE